MDRAQVLHAIEGRLRMRVRAIKNQPQIAARLCDACRRIDGVQTVTANAVTGSLTLTYDGARLSDAALCHELTSAMRIDVEAIPRPSTSVTLPAFVDARNQLVRAILTTAMETAVKRAIFALI